MNVFAYRIGYTALVGGMMLSASLVAITGAMAQGTELIVQTQGGNDNRIFEGFAKIFNELHPDVTVQLQTVTGDQKTGSNLALLGGSNPPDVGLVPINTQVYTEMINGGALLPLDDVYDTDNLRERISPSVYSSFLVDGKAFVVPYTSVFYNVVYVNRDMFDAAGIEFPADHRIPSIDKMIEWAGTLRAEGHEPFALGGSSGYMASWMVDALLPTIATPEQYSNFVQSFNPNVDVIVHYNGPEFTAVIEALKKLNDAQLYQSGFLAQNGDESLTQWLLGRTAMAIGGNFNIAAIKDAKLDFKYDWLVLPSIGPNQARLTQYYGDTLGIPKNAKNPELAKEFLQIVGSNQAQNDAVLQYGYLPSINSLTPEQYAASVDPMIQEMLQDIATNGGVPGWTSTVPGGFGQQFIDPLIQDMYAGNTTPDDIAAKQEQRLEEFRAGDY